MATHNGVQFAKALASPAQLQEQGFNNAGVKILSDKFTLSGDLAAADVIKLGRLPAGARVLNAHLIFSDLDATGGTLDFGWAASAGAAEAADADGFGVNIDVTSAGSYSMLVSGSALPGSMKTFSEGVDVQVVVDGDTDATSGTIEAIILYAID